MSRRTPRPRSPLAHAQRIRRARIVATLGPATDSREQIDALLHAGVDVFRLNFSHGTHEEHGRRIALVRELAQARDQPVAVLQDLQGPKIRTGPLAGGEPVSLVQGQQVVITTLPLAGDATRVSTTYQDLPRDVHPGDAILVDDGRLRLRVVATSDTDVSTVVELGGLLREHKGINLPGVRLSTPGVTDKDKDDLAFGLAHGVDYVALSFVRSADDLRAARRWLERHGADTPLIAKLETVEAIDNLGSIVAASDAVMVARGDLGVELGPEQVPILQKRIIRAANQRGIPVITATQMLESMTTNASPTRAEAADIANAVWDNTDALMLSGETAVGRYPVETVTTMARIIVAAEGAQAPAGTSDLPRVTPAHAITRAACSLSDDLAISVILAFTRTGRTAHLLSQDRPRALILALTPDERIYRRLALWWGVRALTCLPVSDTEALLQQMEQEVLRRGLAQRGESVVVVGAMPHKAGVHTNFVKLHTLGRGR